MTAPDDVRARFEAWYVENAFDYGRNPLGSRECGLQWKAWQAARAKFTQQVMAVRFDYNRRGGLTVDRDSLHESEGYKRQVEALKQLPERKAVMGEKMTPTLDGKLRCLQSLLQQMGASVACKTVGEARDALLTAHLTQPAQAVDVGAAGLQARANEIEDAICRGNMDVYQVFTQMRQLLPRALGNAQAEGWRPIESAPKNSECVLLSWREHDEWQVMPGSFKTSRVTASSGWVVAAMDHDYLNGGDGQRFSDFSVTPTHWQPLPTPPQPEE